MGYEYESSPEGSELKGEAPGLAPQFLIMRCQHDNRYAVLSFWSAWLLVRTILVVCHLIDIQCGDVSAIGHSAASEI